MSVFESKKETIQYTHTHNAMLASQSRNRVKNGTCQERSRQERGAITRDSEREAEEEWRNNRKIRDT